MFLIRYFNTGTSTYQVVSLSPAPTEVDYPESRSITNRTTKDGNVVIQRPVRDSRSRKWIWKNYRAYMVVYENQWQFLKTLESKTRLDAGAPNAIVQIWEDESLEGGFGETTDDLDPDLSGYTNIQWTDVRFIQVHRKSKPGGGPATYEESYIEFVIDDSDWDNF